ncbi:hypothetical protein ACYF6T_38095 [Streptomyces sp. 7R007]
MNLAADPANTLRIDPANGNLPPLWFLVPEGFFTLPLATTPEDRTESARSFVRELYSRGDESLWEPAAPYYAAIAQLMGDSGISYAAMGLFSTAGDDEASDAEAIRNEPSAGVAQCALTVAITSTDQSSVDTDSVAQGMLAALSGDPYNNAIWLDLPCGPAVSCITLREYSFGADIAANGEDIKLLTGQIQVYVPFPTGPFIAVFTLHTASMDHWAEIYRMLSAILQTVSFMDPLGELRGEAPDSSTT